MGQVDQAEDFYRQALQEEPNNPDGLHLLAIIASETGRAEEAVELMEKAVLADPRNPQFSDNLGQLYMKCGRIDEAIEAYNTALRVDPKFADALNNLGNALAMNGQLEEAVGQFRVALEIDPMNPRIQYNLATTLSKKEDLSLAIEGFRKVLGVAPDYTDAHNNLGECLYQQGEIDEAKKHLERALELNPDFVSAYNNIGNVFVAKANLNEAINHFRRAIDIDQGNVEGWNNLGGALNKAGKPDEAMTCLREALKIDPNYDVALGNLWHGLMNTCSWDEVAEMASRLDSLNQRAFERDETPAESPLTTLTRSSDLQTNFRIAKSYSGVISRRMADIGLNLPMENRRVSKPVLNIGYLSYDFRDHVVSHFVSRMFGMHDRQSFNIVGYSSGPDDGSRYRKEIERGCDKFIDIRAMTHADAARQIYDDEIDILIDLNGFTAGYRLEIAALRPAPIQVNYLGFPGTTGADFFDYIFLDSVVLSEEEEAYFSETVVYLPPYYVVGAPPAKVTPESPAREDVGLPAEGFVFCSFNKANKLEPQIFDTWLKLLQKVPDSVLWLFDDNPFATENLKREASQRNVDSDRLVFAKTVPKEQHLARLALADIALDTRIYNGGATTSDALWAGVPVITLRGSHVPSRASSSMLTSLGITELITENLVAYETLALRLANDPNELQRLKRNISMKAPTAPLFDTALAVRHLEKAYRQVWDDFVNSEEAH